MMDPAIVDFLSNIPLQAILLVAIIVLWRENRKLTTKLEEVRQSVASLHGIVLSQNAQIHDLTSQKVDWKGGEVYTPQNPWNT